MGAERRAFGGLEGSGDGGSAAERGAERSDAVTHERGVGVGGCAASFVLEFNVIAVV